MGWVSLVMGLMLLFASPGMGYSQDPSRVTILDAVHRVERGIDGVVIVWISGRLQHTLAMPVMVKLETTVFDPAGRFLGAYSFITDPIPPQTPRGFRNVALGENLPPGTVVGKVNVQAVQVFPDRTR